jgi:hypothetical protein
LLEQRGEVVGPFVRAFEQLDDILAMAATLPIPIAFPQRGLHLRGFPETLAVTGAETDADDIE